MKIKFIFYSGHQNWQFSKNYTALNKQQKELQKSSSKFSKVT